MGTDMQEQRRKAYGHVRMLLIDDSRVNRADDKDKQLAADGLITSSSLLS